MNIFFLIFIAYSLLFKLALCVWRSILINFSFSPQFSRFNVDFSYKTSCQSGKSWLKVNWLFQSGHISREKLMMACGNLRTGIIATSVRSERKIDSRAFHKIELNHENWEKNHFFCYNADKVYQNDKWIIFKIIFFTNVKFLSKKWILVSPTRMYIT